MYRPLPKQVTIKESKIHGLGIFAVTNIPKDTVLGMTHFKHIDHPDGWLRTPLGGFYNHSATPNCKLIDGYFGVAEYKDVSKLLCTIKNIYTGEELTCTYTLYKLNSIIKERDLQEDWLGL